MLSYIFLYIVTGSDLIGAIAFNTSFAVAASFESLHIIDRHAVSLIKEECKNFPLCNYNSNIFYIYDFMIHGTPFLFYIFYHSFVYQNTIILMNMSCISCGMHLTWGYLMTNGKYKLEFLYIPSSTYKLSKQSWKKLWLITLISHFALPVYKQLLEKN